MTLTEEQHAQLLEAAKPLMKFLNENAHPHTKVIVEVDSAELVEGVSFVSTIEFIKD